MSKTEHFDVVIVGAGISGIDAAYNLLTKSPDRSFVILEGRDSIGGTWDLFRYPGVRSDSDMHTLGFGFKPWTKDESIAKGETILEYLEETIEENHIDRFVRLDHLVSNASWSSQNKVWTVSASCKGEPVEITCNFLFMCAGYYSYKEGHKPDIAGLDDFDGPVVHPQEWPEGLDYTDKKVVVIGSGATAVTLVPAMAETAAKVTMLQRSPTWMIVQPAVDKLAVALRKVLPEEKVYKIIRKKNAWQHEYAYRKSRTHPNKVADFLRKELRKHLPEDAELDPNFEPRYDPWDERLCLVPDADFFEAMKAGRAEVVTDTIKTVVADGIELDSGNKLEADIIVTATGLKIVTLGEVMFDIDGKQIDFANTWTYKGMGFSGVPNLVSSFGYVNASWTLRADITCDFVARLLNHMRDIGATTATPTVRPQDEGMEPRPWVDGFNPGYLARSMDQLPKQGDKQPWINTQSYSEDLKLITGAPIEDDALEFD